jgi:ABC-type Zn uptake system ZnuABC Zn-binding protein ZnuA
MLLGMRPSRSISVVSLIAVLVLSASGCGDDSSPSTGATKVTVVATTTQVADLVREVGGDRVDVRQILQPNSDPHAYEPRPSDVRSLADAEVVFESGGDLDSWLDGLVENAGGDVRRVELIQAVPTIPDDFLDEAHAGEEGDGEHPEEKVHDHGESADPHWWQDPRNAIAAVAAIRAALIAADPEGRAGYDADAHAYTERLRRLDRGVRACIGEIPPAQRKLVTTHDSLGYYADRYGIEVVGALIPSLSSAAQPSAGDTQDLVDRIEAQRVEAVFPEGSLDPRLERAVSRETGAAVGRALWADALGPAGSDGETYVESIQSNTAALVEGLTGGAERCRPRA